MARSPARGEEGPSPGHGKMTDQEGLVWKRKMSLASDKFP